jgi:hypothetical protein
MVSYTFEILARSDTLARFGGKQQLAIVKNEK